MKVLPLVAAAALTTGLTACGTQAAPPAAGTGTAAPARTVTANPQPTGTASRHPPSPAPTLTGPVTLTTADNGAAVRLHVGQQVAITLASAGSFSWHVPAAAGRAR